MSACVFVRLSLPYPLNGDLRVQWGVANAKQFITPSADGKYRNNCNNNKCNKKQQRQKHKFVG